MNISASDQNGVMVFVLEGRIDSVGASEMDGALQKAAGQGKYKMVLDMSDVTVYQQRRIYALWPIF